MTSHVHPTMSGGLPCVTVTDSINHSLETKMTIRAEAAGHVGMVNLTYRNVPALQQARGIIAEGAIGEVRHVEASYRQSWPVSNQWGDCTALCDLAVTSAVCRAARNWSHGASRSSQTPSARNAQQRHTLPQLS
jgi:predicted dehydrogenase